MESTAEGIIVLPEFGSCEIELSPGERAQFRSRFAGRLDLTPTERAGVYRITARDYIGRVALAHGRVLVIEPKVEVANLFYMLCGAINTVRFYSPPVALAAQSDLFALILQAILAETERLLTRGLQRDYARREESLGLIRGGIALSAQISRYGALKDRHICRFVELTHDTAENKVVATTLRFAASLLASNTEGGMMKTLREVLARFEGVAQVGREAALGNLRHIRKHRLNMAYWPLLGLCGLFLRGLSLSEESGPRSFPSFLVNMSHLFESFLTTRLRAVLPRLGLRVVAQRHDYLDLTRQVGIRPDVLVCDAVSGNPLLVLDAKYKLPNSGHDDLNRDIYQVSAYMDRYGLRRGVLVYPRWEGSHPARLRLRNTPKELYVATVNLAAPGAPGLDLEYSALAAEVAGLAEGNGVAG